MVLLVSAFQVGVATADGALATPRPRVVHSVPSSIPTLRNAVALGTLVLLDPKTGVAGFHVTCGWYVKPKRRVRVGLWRVALRAVQFNWETYPNGPASGVAHTVSISTWEDLAKHDGWSGTLYLAGRSQFLTNGPTTDICAGVLG